MFRATSAAIAGMGNTVKKLFGMGAKVMNKVEDAVSGGSSTSNTLFSQVADPFRKARQNYQAGAGVSPADMLDPNSKLHSQDTAATIAQKQADAAAAAQYAIDQLKAPSLDTATNASRQEQDRLRRRRGILANLYGGTSSSAPTVGVKSLLGS